MKLRREGSTIWVAGTLADNRPHQHHALQMTWSAPGGFARMTVGDDVFEGSCLVVDGGVTHSLEMRDGLIALIDSSSAAARAFRAEHLDGARVGTFESHWNGQLDKATLDALVGYRESLPPRGDLDERVDTVLSWLDDLEECGRWPEATLEGALARAHLSDSRFLHLFSEHVGTPWRTYLVWRRALVAMTHALEGASLTHAALAAGYADSAHLSRQFVALFGVTPAAFARNVQARE